MTKDYDYDKILQGILDIGEEMIVAGAEVSRVEDSISRMCRSYGETGSMYLLSFPIYR